MDNKVTKGRVSNHLEYDWVKYLIIFVVIIIGLYFVFDMINKTKDDEDITIFASCYGYKQSSFESDVLDSFSKATYDQEYKSIYGDNILREFYVDKQNLTDTNYSTILSTRGTFSSDAIILGENTAFASALNYVQITPEILDLLGINKNDYKFLRYEEVTEDGVHGYKVLDDGSSEYDEKYTFGIRIDNYNGYSGLSKISNLLIFDTTLEDTENTKHDKKFYFFINSNSVNIGKYGKGKDKNNMQGFYCFKQFFDTFK